MRKGPISAGPIAYLRMQSSVPFGPGIDKGCKLMWAVNLPTLLSLRRPDAWISLRMSRFGYLRPLRKEREEQQRNAAAHAHQMMMHDMMWSDLHRW